ncbi:hypothetical protein N7537_001081 [Penicillium hordei]|uniref:Uncharacterized protein n=1 Tax=Penicillium hordei TaxID=40994 RepID=A0AAD6EEU4_9EURO|nr:uncharacterized protein N7537_001081 [Penicillium hordei]KAJ5615967.1 hypothetical protein N7537_001081 [Penicillium hordei]
MFAAKSSSPQITKYRVIAANNHGDQLAADIKSGEDAENRDQSELGEPGIDCLGSIGIFAYWWDALINLLGTTLRTYPCVLVSSSHLSWHVLVFWKRG